MTAETETQPTTLPALRDMVFALNPSADADTVLAVRDRVKAIKQQIAEVDKQLTESLIEWIDANGDIEVGDGTRLYVGPTKKTTCPDVGRTLEALIDKTNGDFERVVECLASQPIKHGTARFILEDDWSRHFDVEEIKDVKTGKVKKTVKVADPRFIKHTPTQESNSDA